MARLFTRVTTDTVIKSNPGRVYRIVITWGGGTASTAGKVWALYNSTSIGAGTALLDGVIESTHGTLPIQLETNASSPGLFFDTGIVFAQNDLNGVIRAVIEYE